MIYITFKTTAILAPPVVLGRSENTLIQWFQVWYLLASRAIGITWLFRGWYFTRPPTSLHVKPYCTKAKSDILVRTPQLTEMRSLLLIQHTNPTFRWPPILFTASSFLRCSPASLLEIQAPPAPFPLRAGTFPAVGTGPRIETAAEHAASTAVLMKGCAWYHCNAQIKAEKVRNHVPKGTELLYRNKGREEMNGRDSLSLPDMTSPTGLPLASQQWHWLSFTAIHAFQRANSIKGI